TDTEEEKREKEREKQGTCWTIGDIVRRARAVVIAVPGPLDESLKEWGKRV
ncbi:MAG: hypothetical protein Q9191_008314, partial [Dirinaria sp. TL-2023a]